MLFQKGTIGKFELKNRIIMLPTVTNMAVDGHVSDKELSYYDKRSKDVSLVIVEASYVNKLGKFFVNQLGIDDDGKLDGLRKLADLLHKNGAKAGIQLAMHNPRYKPTDFERAQIQGFVQDFADGAMRAKKAGFDLVELHFAHGWLVNQFLSPAVNKRVDEYGGDFEGRSRFALEILRKVKEQVPEMTVICRINASDFTDGGFDIEESIKFARLLEANGADGLDVSAGVGSTSEYHISPMSIDDRPILSLVKRIKENVNIPIIAANKLGFAKDWEEIINNNIADFIGIARGLIGDPECITKLKNGNIEDIRYCIHCNQACIAYILNGLPISCMINPEVGREKEFEVKTDRLLNIAVIGGGPAGMSSAIYLSKKGHKVDLFEKSDSLGGQLKVAKVPPHKSEIGRVIEYLKNDLRKYHVNVYLNRNISVQDLKNMPYDKIIIATGSVPADLAIKSDIKPYQAIEILTGKIPAGKKIAIIGGGLTGLETAAYLAMQGKDVTVFEVKDEVGEGVFSMVRKLLLKNLNKLNVNIVTKAIIKEISNGKLICSIKDGANKVFNVDDVVLATGVVPDKTFTELQGDDRYYFVGDCKEIATAVEAIRDGAEVSLKI